MAARRRSRIRELSVDPTVAARQAKDLCLRMLTDRARTRHELEEALLAEGVSPEICTSVLDRLVELRLLDDGAYAEAFVRSRQRAGVAKRTVTRELRAKGVGDQEAEVALASIDAETEREAAYQFAERRAVRTAGLPGGVRRRRLYGMLARRGYPSDVVASAVEHALGESVESEGGFQEPDQDLDPGLRHPEAFGSEFQTRSTEIAR